LVQTVQVSPAKGTSLAPYQAGLLNDPARYTVCYAATKTGKTASHIVWLAIEALKGVEGQRFWWVAPTYRQAEIAFRRMQAQFGMSKEKGFSSIKSPMLIHFPNGTTVEFLTAQEPDNLFGEDVGAVVLDEFTRMKAAAWDAIRSTLTKTRARAKFIGNPKGTKNWGHKLVLRAQAGHKDWSFHRFTAWDAVKAGILEAEEVEQAREDLPDLAFRELYLAEVLEDSANPFRISSIRAATRAMSTDTPYYFGVDLAKKVDYTVIIGLDEEGQCAYYERFHGSSWDEITRRIVSAVGRNYVLVDSTGVGDPVFEDIAEGNNLAEGFKFTTESRQALLVGLAKSIQEGSISIPEEHPEVVAELEAFEYTYTPSGKVKYEAPSGMHDDTVMALALAAECKRRHKTLEVWGVW